ncbi:unnamed protein product [Nesidiocoris tenuis]|uniref:Uncharacterized protein n=1 Tax=Nesidiocoris tenuis TaxID=355587 RepID=A0A6H5GR75_9HEMI|nr:unnamed protein product [Nesidiocoris tenuis]
MSCCRSFPAMRTNATIVASQRHGPRPPRRGGDRRRAAALRRRRGRRVIQSSGTKEGSRLLDKARRQGRPTARRTPLSPKYFEF